MDAIKLLTERRSIRRFKDETVDRNLMKEIVDLSRWSPSWGNKQVARYTLVDDLDIIQQIGEDGVNDFVYNVKALKSAPGVCVLSYKKGKSGKFDTDEFVTSKTDWEVFDAGIAALQFCLSAHIKGVGTTIMGVFDDKVVAKLVDLPQDETVAAIIVYGYPKYDHPAPTPRKEVNDLLRFK